MAGGDQQARPTGSDSMNRACSARRTSARFHNDRSRLIESVGREAQRVVDTYDRRREAEMIADQARVAVAAAAAARRCRGRPGHARDDRRIDGGRRRDRHSARQRRARRRLLDHPRPPQTGEGTLGEKVADLRARLHAALRSGVRRARENRVGSGSPTRWRRIRDSCARRSDRWRAAQQALSGLAEQGDRDDRQDRCCRKPPLTGPSVSPIFCMRGSSRPRSCRRLATEEDRWRSAGSAR